jgi:adenylate cyclase class IV
MKRFIESPDNVESRVEELNEQYSEDLDKLYMALAEEYMDEEEDRYYSFDANELLDKDSQVRILGQTPAMLDRLI